MYEFFAASEIPLVCGGSSSRHRWRDGEPEIIDDLSGVRGVNSDGTIAGSGRDGAWRYADGAVSELDEPRGGDVDVNGINDNGDVVATVRDADAESEVADGDPVSSRGYPLLWKAGTDKPVELEVADGKRAHADAVTEDGTVLGYQVDNGTDKPVPWRWNSRGEGERLPRLPGDEDGGPQAVPVDVAGDWVLLTNAPDGYRWKLSAPDKAERLKLDSQSAVAVDSRGLAYGLAEWGVPGRQSGDKVMPLKNLTDDPSGGDAGANTLKGASDDGTVLIGSSVDEKGTARAVTWTCG
ncbi:hypothetical protein [Stackebrandtia nassauensis]|uniref:hypothetical protein n=1 Tax=Stackebrandtia nassauensis TaxID=283811 RepID=UPI000325737F|nr:hypothetical protein [Stackebrandtia nassauensis]